MRIITIAATVLLTSCAGVQQFQYAYIEAGANASTRYDPVCRPGLGWTTESGYAYSGSLELGLNLLESETMDLVLVYDHDSCINGTDWFPRDTVGIRARKTIRFGE